MKKRYIILLASSVFITVSLMAIFLTLVALLEEEYTKYLKLITIVFLVLEGLVGLLFISLMIVDINKENKVINEQSQVNTKLVETVSVANKANAAKSDFLSRISHDIRTPMNGIVGMTQIAKNNIDDKEKVSYCLNKIETASGHLLTLLNNVLDLSKIESGVVKLNVVPVNILELVKNCESMIIPQADNLTIKVESNFNIVHNMVLVDDLRLKQILINILSNAVKFNFPEGKVYFKVEEKVIDSFKSQFIFTVKDTGMGMSDNFLSHIFEPFVQEDDTSARTKYTGSGLGMAIVKQLVDLMGGSISITSKENVGTEMIISVNLDFLKDKEEIEAKKNEYQELKGLKVLVVEDNDINMEIIDTLLNEVGVIVSKAFDGSEAVHIFEASEPNSFDVILMDILMPVMNGYNTTKTIRDLNRIDAKEIPIIAMTANAYDKDKKKAMEAGMNGYIIKPIKIEKLYDMLLSYKK